MELMQQIGRLYEDYAKAKGMTYMSMSVLEAIYEHQQGCTQKLICQETHYPKQNVNLIVKSFLLDGYVVLQELPADRRNKQIALTEKGRAYAEEMVGKLWQVDADATEALTASQREELLKLIAIYAGRYEEGVRRLIAESKP
ncbi:MAG: MarR family winged helix-turn-helix transcriptional regulator [Eubacteriales bacterium]|nr:MarR family winged helix-turn-helix transcriptional regulator [Eubacteriales bacterium]